MLKLNCGSCDKFYIGKHIGNLKRGYWYTKKNFECKETESNYSNQLIEENHSFYSHFKILLTEIRCWKI